MEKICIFNIKGGVGKTTSAINLAGCLQEEGKKVLLVDLDSQANATMTMQCYSMQDLTVADVLLEKDLNIKDVIKHTEFDGIDMIPSNINLSFTEKEILVDVQRSQQFRLRNALKKVEDEYDYCIIDCPPALNTITVNALVTSDKVLVPIKIDKYALDGLEYLLKSITQMKEEFNPNLEFGGCFITMDTSTTVNNEIKKELRNLLGDKIFKTTIRHNVKVVESTFENSPVIYSYSKAKASKNYRELCKEVFA